MTNFSAQDELDLAEGVASGELALREAELRLGAGARSRRSTADISDLHRTIAAIRAVRAHARATRAAEHSQEAAGVPSSVPLPAARDHGAGHLTVATDRPGIVTTVHAGPVRPRTRRIHDGRALAIAATLVVIAGALGFTFSGGRVITPSPRPSANALATFATSAPTPAPAAVAFRAADRPEVFASTVQFALTSAAVGWLRAADPASGSGGLFRTSDAGRTWTQLTEDASGLARFVDDVTAYIAQAGGVVLATHDGGATWHTASVDVPSGAIGPWLLTAASPDVAFITFAAGETSTDLVVYSTADGGLTWSGPSHGTVAVLDAAFNKPQGGENGLLWMTLGKADNKPFDNRLAISLDGGTSWSIQPLPADSVFPASNLKGPSALRADGEGRETLALGDSDRTGIYRTGDAGQTWTSIRTWQDVSVVELRSASEWTATTPTAFWSTTDGGQTWRQTARDGEPRVVGITFATPDIGWGEVVCGHPAWKTQVTPDPLCSGRTTGVVLMTTQDGGATWSPIGG